MKVNLYKSCNDKFHHVKNFNKSKDRHFENLRTLAKLILQTYLISIGNRMGILT